MDLKQEIKDYLKTQRLMSVATFADRPWIANVYYVHDDDLNLYFLSKKTREHCLAIEKNPNVAVAIADSHQPLKPPQKGLQIFGTAAAVNVIEQIEWMFKMWNALIVTDKEDMLADPKQFLQLGNSKIYRITPKRIKFFNTGLWPDEQTQVWSANNEK